MPQTERIRTILDAPGETPYAAAKTRLLDIYGESPHKKVRKLIDSNANSMIDLKPSLVLEKIKNLGGDLVGDALCKEFWLEKISPDVRLIITPSQSLPIADLAKQADSVAELLEKKKPTVASVNLPTPSQTQNFVPQQSPQASTATMDALLLCIQQMSADISELRRSRSRTPNRKRTQSRGRRDQTPGKTQLYEGYCWYHKTFGDRSYKCKVGCKEYSDKFRSEN